MADDISGNFSRNYDNPVTIDAGITPGQKGSCESFLDSKFNEIVVCRRDPGLSYGEMIQGISVTASVIVALVSVLSVHYFSIKRQRRDEQFALCQSSQKLAEDIADKAVKIWIKPGREIRRDEISDLILGLGALGRRLEMLRRRKKYFDFAKQMAEFRSTTTKDIEDRARAPDQSRAEQVRLAQGDLDSAIDTAFHRMHG